MRLFEGIIMTFWMNQRSRHWVSLGHEVTLVKRCAPMSLAIRVAANVPGLRGCQIMSSCEDDNEVFRLQWWNFVGGFRSFLWIPRVKIKNKDKSIYDAPVYALYNYIIILYNSLGSFGLTLVWCRCVSQVLVAPWISKCREFGVSCGDYLWRPVL